MYDMIHLSNNLLINKPQFSMKVPVVILILAILIVHMIILISSRLSLKKINKLSPIEAIRSTSTIKTTKKQLKSSNILEKLGGIEGIIAHKNINRDKSRYKTITISLTVSIILFLSASGIASNFYKSDVYGYLLSYLNLDLFEDMVLQFSNSSENQKDIYNVIDYLETNNLIDGYCSYSLGESGIMKLTENETSEELKAIVDDGLISTDVNGKLYVPLNTICYYNEAYTTILKKAGVSNLLDDEVILMDFIIDKSKYGDKFRLTNYKVGDSYISTIDGKEKTFRIVGIIDDFSPYIIKHSNNSDLSSPGIIQVVNENNLKKDNYIYLALDTDRFYEIDERLGEMSNIVGGELTSSRIKIMAESTKIQKTITETVINCFVGLLILVSAVNIFNTISSCILLRKRDFAVLKSMGMSKKQINKMIFLEGIFYGLDSIFYGTTISILILFFVYQQMDIDSRMYPFTISWLNIMICIAFVYTIIFISMRSSKKKIEKENIIEEIKKENI